MEFIFVLVLVGLAILFGLVWLLDRLFFYGQRKRRAAEQGKKVRDPWPVDWARSLFPVVLAVLLLRSFVAEPFRIPSGSMMPTLDVGDFILVNKFSYGLRLPILHTRFLDLGHPERGDIIVFRFPGYLCADGHGGQVRTGDPTCQDLDTPVPRQDWIKRVVGLPGDHVVVKGEKVWVNGKRVRSHLIGPYQGDADKKSQRYIIRHGGVVMREHLGGIDHKIIEMPSINMAPGVPSRVNPATVPPHCYFVMGDDRDNSEDSRYWGCVPEKNVTGKAFFIWFSLSSLSRIGTILH